MIDFLFKAGSIWFCGTFILFLWSLFGAYIHVSLIGLWGDENWLGKTVSITLGTALFGLCLFGTVLLCGICVNLQHPLF